MLNWREPTKQTCREQAVGAVRATRVQAGGQGRAGRVGGNAAGSGLPGAAQGARSSRVAKHGAHLLDVKSCCAARQGACGQVVWEDMRCQAAAAAGACRIAGQHRLMLDQSDRPMLCFFDTL